MQVRAANLQDLVYKQGQAGITKASVSITFKNDDPRTSPAGYEDKETITVTRTVSVVSQRPLQARVLTARSAGPSVLTSKPLPIFAARRLLSVAVTSTQSMDTSPRPGKACTAADSSRRST